VAWIDDMTGTLGPYSQDIVLGPSNPEVVARRFSDEFGCGAVVADVNDLRRVEILGSCRVTDRGALAEALRANPQGNDDEQTPLVLLRR
jgi:hypothetical protein